MFGINAAQAPDCGPETRNNRIVVDDTDAEFIRPTIDDRREPAVRQ